MSQLEFCEVFFQIKRGPSGMDEARPWWRVTALLVCLCGTLVGLWQYSAQPARSGERPECVFHKLIHIMAMVEWADESECLCRNMHRIDPGRRRAIARFITAESRTRPTHKPGGSKF